jgi:predicted transglutaminase-like cysteine proteinase
MAESVSFRFLGDKNKGKNFVGAAKQGIEVLKNLMQLGGLNSYSLSKTFSTGETIFLKSNFGITTAYIYCPTAAGGLSAKERRTREIEVWTTYKTGEQHNYFIFHKKDAKFTVTNCKYTDNTFTEISGLNYLEMLVSNNTYPVKFHCKRFSHNVPNTDLDGVVTITTRDLYFVATSLYIPQDLYLGWKNFAAANPTFPLVTNNSTNSIILTGNRYETLEYVNRAVNSAHKYSGDSGGDNWKILANGETGDCEDFALTKAKMLLDLGYPASALHIECAMYKDSPTPNNGHAWLVVQTDQGDYALDNLHNELQANINMKSIIDTDYIMRRRQIGMNWACIDSMSWLIDAVNYDTYLMYYIFDPLLDIFHYVGYWFYPAITNGKYLNGINFSADNNYVYFTTQELSYYTLYKISLSENKITVVSTGTYTKHMFDEIAIDRNGQLVEGGDYVIVSYTFIDLPYRQMSDLVDYLPMPSNVKSVSGYYEYTNTKAYRHIHRDYLTDTPAVGVATRLQEDYFNAPNKYTLEYSWTEVMGAGQLISILEALYSENSIWNYPIPVRNEQDGFQMLNEGSGYPWARVNNYTEYTPYVDISVGPTYNGNTMLKLLTFFDDDSVIIHGFKTVTRSYMYRNSIDILSSLLAVIDITDNNLLGFVYLPFTNRLRGAKTLKTITIEE